MTFTGSTPVGMKLMQYSGQSNLKRTFLELGGKSPNIVFADADLEKAATMAAVAVFYNGGQTCTAGTRLIVEEKIMDRFLEMVTAKAQGWMPGDPLDPATAMGPMIDAAQCDTVAEYVDIGRGEGAEMLFGGQRVLQETGGHYFQPSIFAGVNNAMRIAQEEIFGPVAPIFKFKTEEEAIAMANDTEFGLAAYLFTRDQGRSWRVSEGIEYGMVGVNEVLISSTFIPFGGIKESGQGREGSSYGVDDYLEMKYICFGDLGA